MLFIVRVHLCIESGVPSSSTYSTVLTQTPPVWPCMSPHHVPVMQPDSVQDDSHQRWPPSCLVCSNWQRHRLPRCFPLHSHHHQSRNIHGIYQTNKMCWIPSVVGYIHTSFIHLCLFFTCTNCFLKNITSTRFYCGPISSQQTVCRRGQNWSFLIGQVMSSTPCRTQRFQFTENNLFWLWHSLSTHCPGYS